MPRVEELNPKFTTKTLRCTMLDLVSSSLMLPLNLVPAYQPGVNVDFFWLEETHVESLTPTP